MVSKPGAEKVREKSGEETKEREQRNETLRRKNW
jgi:hypothetical protein